MIDRYLANDFQFFIFAPFIALLAFWNHVVALTILGLGCVASIVYAHVEALNEHWTLDFFTPVRAGGLGSSYIQAFSL